MTWSIFLTRYSRVNVNEHDVFAWSSLLFCVSSSRDKSNFHYWISCQASSVNSVTSKLSKTEWQQFAFARCNPTHSLALFKSTFNICPNASFLCQRGNLDTIKRLGQVPKRETQGDSGMIHAVRPEDVCYPWRTAKKTCERSLCARRFG